MASLAQPGSAAEAARQRGTAADQFNRPLIEPTEEVEGDLLLLVEHDLFFAAATASAEITDNAFRDANAQDDIVGLVDLIVGVDTLVDDRYDVAAWFGAGVSRYQDFDELDSDYTSLGLAGSTQLETYRVGAIVTGVFSNARGPGSDDLTDLGITVFASRQWRLDNGVVVFGEARLQRFFSDPNDYSATNVGVSLGFVYAPSPVVSVRGNVLVEYDYYDDYFPDTFTESRADFFVTPELTLAYQVTPNIVARAGVSFWHNSSTLDTFDYEAFTITPSLVLSTRF